MKFLKKQSDSKIIKENLSYSNSSDRKEIRELLIAEQYEFCAYSERFIKKTDSVDIEHFNPTHKGTHTDNYYNWYAVLNWMNTHKPKKINSYLPILEPHSEDLLDRI